MNSLIPTASPSVQPTSLRRRGSLPWSFMVFIYLALAFLVFFAVVCVVEIVRRRFFRHVECCKRQPNDVRLPEEDTHENMDENCIIETTATYGPHCDVELAIMNEQELVLVTPHDASGSDVPKDLRWKSLLSASAAATKSFIYRRPTSTDPVIATADIPPTVEAEPVRMLESMPVDYNHFHTLGPGPGPGLGPGPLTRQLGTRGLEHSLQHTHHTHSTFSTYSGHSARSARSAHSAGPVVPTARAVDALPPSADMPSSGASVQSSRHRLPPNGCHTITRSTPQTGVGNHADVDMDGDRDGSSTSDRMRDRGADSGGDSGANSSVSSHHSSNSGHSDRAAGPGFSDPHSSRHSHAHSHSTHQSHHSQSSHPSHPGRSDHRSGSSNNSNTDSADSMGVNNLTLAALLNEFRHNEQLCAEIMAMRDRIAVRRAVANNSRR